MSDVVELLSPRVSECESPGSGDLSGNSSVNQALAGTTCPASQLDGFVCHEMITRTRESGRRT